MRRSLLAPLAWAFVLVWEPLVRDRETRCF